MPAPVDSPTPSLVSWLRATWLSWILGMPCIVLLALLGEALGLGGKQVLVGAGTPCRFRSSPFDVGVKATAAGRPRSSARPHH